MVKRYLDVRRPNAVYTAPFKQPGDRPMPTESLKGINDTLSDIRDVLKKLSNQLEEARTIKIATGTMGHAGSGQPVHQPHPRPCLPDPAKLSKPNVLDVWLRQMKGKMRIDGDAIGSPEAQFYYVLSCLKPNMQKVVIPVVDFAVENKHWDYTEIFRRLLDFHGGH
ncbi:hypothetical protein GGS26DRAFT_587054 [Hypomontagnella submonticulosa]|nr:hypothetical protein GGS26DRAFT_587054 [Hypomontagnella submonticulosa]